MTTTVVSTIRASGGDYSSLTAWEAGEQADLVSADEIAVAECYHDWASGLSDNLLVIDGWVTGASNYIKIVASSNSGTEGASAVDFSDPENTGFLSKHTSTAHHQKPISIKEAYTVIEGIRMLHVGGAYWMYGIALEATTCTIQKNSIVCTGTNASYSMISEHAAVGGHNINRNYIRSNSANKPGFAIINAYPRSYVYSNVFRDADPGVKFDHWPNDDVRNNVFYNCASGITDTGYTDGGEIVDANAFSDATGYGTNAITSIGSSEFTDAANDDFHLDSGSSLIDAGANLYSTFQYDVDGDEWPSSGAWDIGFDYYVAGGGAPTLSSPGVINVLSDRATPQVTLTF